MKNCVTFPWEDTSCQCRYISSHLTGYESKDAGCNISPTNGKAQLAGSTPQAGTISKITQGFSDATRRKMWYPSKQVTAKAKKRLLGEADANTLIFEP